jgi:hypothetical protein
MQRRVEGDRVLDRDVGFQHGAVGGNPAEALAGEGRDRARCRRLGHRLNACCREDSEDRGSDAGHHPQCDTVEMVR